SKMEATKPALPGCRFCGWGTKKEETSADLFAEKKFPRRRVLLPAGVPVNRFPRVGVPGISRLRIIGRLFASMIISNCLCRFKNFAARRFRAAIGGGEAAAGKGFR